MNHQVDQNNKTYAIRFGLGAIKAVGFNMMTETVNERNNHGKFKDIYDYCKRVDAKSINKKSIEALSKSGSFDCFDKNRRKFFESFDILANFANEAKEQANSNQMNLFGGIAEENNLPPLKNPTNWTKKQRLTNEFEAFGFFLNEHPIDDKISELKKRGIIFSTKIEEDLLDDNTIVKLAGVVASSKHRSGSKGRFCYLNISDPFGIYEVTIFDEALITANRDLLEDGSEIVIECLIRKDEGGSRIMVKGVFAIDEFINQTKPSDKEFEDIKKLPPRKEFKGQDNKFSNNKNSTNFSNNPAPNYQNKPDKNIDSSLQNSQTSSTNLEENFDKIEILISDNSAILPLKTVLSQKINIGEKNDGKTTIILVVNDQDKTTKIQLAGLYKIQELDIFRLKNLHPKIKIINV
jgi:DNA polymerase III alpha subunit